MKVYLAFEFYDNGMMLEDKYSVTTLLGSYGSMGSARDAIDRYINDCHEQSIGIGTSDERLPKLDTIVNEELESKLEPYVAMISDENETGWMRSWQYYTIEMPIHE